MKKTLALAMITVLALSTVFTGCKKKNSSKQEETSSTEPTTAFDINTFYEKSEYELLNFNEFVSFADLTGLLELTAEDYTVTDEDLQAEIDFYTKEYGTFEWLTEGVVKDGDTVKIDYTGYLNGETFEGGTDTDSELEIGSDSFIEGFEDGLIGVNVGETVSLNLTFPEKYHEELAGKDVVFEVKVNSIKGNVTPAEYTDDFVKEITSGAYTTVEDFNKYCMSFLNMSKKMKLVEKFQEAIAEKSTFTDAISTYVDKEYQLGIEYYESYASSYGMTLEALSSAFGYESLDKLKEELRSDAETYIKEVFTIYAYGKSINFEPTNEDYLATVQTLVDTYGYASVESLLSQYETSTIRYEVYCFLLADEIAETFKTEAE